MALLTVQQIVIGGLAPTYVAVAASDTIPVADDRVMLHVKNASGTQDTVTLTDPGKTPAGSSASNPTVVVPITTGDRMIALPLALADPATGLVTVTHSQTTTVTCAAVRR